MNKKQTTIVLVVASAMLVLLVVLKHLTGRVAYVPATSAVGEAGEVTAAVAAALIAVKEKHLLRGDVHQLTAVRDKTDKKGWVITFLFEDPPIIGGDVTATIHRDGSVTVMPGL